MVGPPVYTMYERISNASSILGIYSSIKALYKLKPKTIVRVHPEHA